MKEKPKSIDGGSQKYWQEVAEGYRLVGRYRQARLHAESEPTHYGFNMNEDGVFEEIEDNLGPWEKMDEAREAAARHRAARTILTSHKLTVDENGSVYNQQGRFATSKDIPVFGGGALESRPARITRA
jgi:hypothetical protein